MNTVETMAAPSRMEPSLELGPRAELAAPNVTLAFMLAGNAHVTFQSRRTGARFTYRIRAVEAAGGPGVGGRPGAVEAVGGRPGAVEGRPGPSHFVSVLTGPDNSRSYEYLGCIYGRRAYAHGRKSRVATDAPSAVAFAWVWRRLSAGQAHPELAVYHEGRCGRCGRRLTTPESVATGLGPVCVERGE